MTHGGSKGRLRGTPPRDLPPGDVLDGIVGRKRAALQQKGPAMGVKLPRRRTAPLVHFGLKPFLICEIKRASPSKGAIAPGADPVRQAAHYVSKGIKTVSVLTEEAHFDGSLSDLIEVKKAFPRLCVLRKDFLLDEGEIDASFRAGADAVLLIARIHSPAALSRLYRRARGMGMEVLLEVHDGEDVEKARAIAPPYTGFNSRDLRTLRVDPLAPVKLRGRVDWETRAVFESGIASEEDGLFALSSGFSGLLVGEAVMRDLGLVHSLLRSFELRAKAGKGNDFWLRLFARRRENRPLVKVCGITNGEDALLARSSGADLLGFVLAPSPRRADLRLLEELAGLDALKVGVVVGSEGAEGEAFDRAGGPEPRELLDRGLIDAVQFHGAEGPDECYPRAFPYYKALRIGSEKDADAAARYRCPRVLADAWLPGTPGGTGRSIPENLVRRVKAHKPLWLAGGIGPGNIGEVIRAFEPELVDASSRLEAVPGRKDPGKLKQFFEELSRETDLP